METSDIIGWLVILTGFLALLFYFVKRRHAREDEWLANHWPEDDDLECGDYEPVQQRSIVSSGSAFGSTVAVTAPEHDWIVPVLIGEALLAGQDHEHDAVDGGTLIDTKPAPDYAPTQCQADGYSGSDSPSYGDGAGASGNSCGDAPVSSDTPTSNDNAGSYDSSSSGSGSYDSSSSSDSVSTASDSGESAGGTW